MNKKKIESEQELKRIEINLDKHTYDYLKSKRINISKMVRQLLKVALFSGSTGYTPSTTYSGQSQTHNLETASPNLVRGISNSGQQFAVSGFKHYPI